MSKAAITMHDSASDDDWYKDAIIYQLHVKAYRDSNADGIGDFAGLTDCLDYIQDLGVNTLWLLPFYPSPLRDDGYDIADYSGVHPDYGCSEDFDAFIQEAHRRGLRVITELVINHTSDQHPWFQRARHAERDSPERNFYVWSDDDQKMSETRIIFTDTEHSNWAWDTKASQYYWHRFFSHQPDLNHNNPAVVEAVIDIMRFWLDKGVDGLRLDAIPYLCVREGTNNENLPETHDVIRRIRAAVDEGYQGRMLLAEANQWPEDVSEYFGRGDECHMAYHFPLMPRMYMALAQEDRHPIVEIMNQTPDIPNGCQWAIFLRNHDELTLEMVTDRERDYMYGVYAVDPRMRVNVGIRRRLATLLENDMDKIQLMNNLLLSMPGSPIIYYGDEIGMGDNIYLGDRNAVRTPMQWSPDRNAGFSSADPQRLYLPPIMDPIHGYQAVNVEAQSRSPSSLLNWMRRMIAIRKNYRAFGRGDLRFIRTGNRKILVFVRCWHEEVILCVSNLSRHPQAAELDLSAFQGRVPVEMVGRTAFPPLGTLPYMLTLPGYGFFWFELSTAAEEPVWHEEHLPISELPVLVLTHGWDSFFAERVDQSRHSVRAQLEIRLENTALPAFLQTRRWFAAKGQDLEHMALGGRNLWQTPHGQWLLARAEVQIKGEEVQSYALPLALDWEDNDAAPKLSAALAKVRQQARVGLLYDAFADPVFCRAIVRAIAEGQPHPLERGQLLFTPTERLGALDLSALDQLEVRRFPGEGSNTEVVLGETLFLKGFRRQFLGLNPELELGRYLSDEQPFEASFPLLGAVEYIDDLGRRSTLCLLQHYQSNQGDLWQFTVDGLTRHLEQCIGKSEDEVRSFSEDELYPMFVYTFGQLGRRTGEMHALLAASRGNPDIDPLELGAAHRSALQQRILDEARQSLEHLARQLNHLGDTARALAERLLARQHQLLARIGSLSIATEVRMLGIRCHGDFELGQILRVRDDFAIIDFEGEPARPLEQRRERHCGLRDLACMMRSLDYAARYSLDHITHDRPHEVERLMPVLETWLQHVNAALVTSYRDVLGEGSSVLPSEEVATILIELYAIERALYELRFELGNRPDWIALPLRGLLHLIGGSAH